jgi:hypothetical protein
MFDIRRRDFIMLHAARRSGCRMATRGARSSPARPFSGGFLALPLRTRPRPALGRLLLPSRLSGVSIHRRLALGGIGGFGAGIRHPGVGHVTRPAEIVGPSARRRDRLAFGERADQEQSSAEPRLPLGQ